MRIHRTTCVFGYSATPEFFEVDRIIDVYGKASRKMFLVQWKGYPGQDSWEPEHSLYRDGCKPSIDEFWLRSDINPALEFYPDSQGKKRCWICGWTSKTNPIGSNPTATNTCAQEKALLEDSSRQITYHC